MSAGTWFALCRLVALEDIPLNERGWSGASSYGPVTQEWEYGGRVYLEIRTGTFDALDRRGLAKRTENDIGKPTAKGQALVEGQGFRL
jgi:hypothetical protein